jgi:hypothetical protein
MKSTLCVKGLLFVVLVSNGALMQGMMVLKNTKKCFEKSMHKQFCGNSGTYPQQNIDKLNETLGVGKNASSYVTEGAMIHFIAQNYFDYRSQELTEKQQLKFELIDTLFTFDVAKTLRARQQQEAMQRLKRISELRPCKDNQE